MEILASRTLLRPKNRPRSTAFYRDILGLHVFREFSGGTVFFLGNGYLEVSGETDQATSDALQLWLQVRDTDAVHAHLIAHGVRIVEPPEDKPWGLRELRARDPDGVMLIFVQVPADHPMRRDTRS